MYRLIMCFVSLHLMSCKDEFKVPDINKNPDTTSVVKPFSNIPPIDEMVVYQVNMRAMSSAGTFGGVEARLDNIQEMGANVIWLMPIYPVGQLKGINSPYAVRDYTEASDEYGGLEALISLVNEAHKRDIAVILDWVANHTAWDHAWVSEHKDWYSQDANGNIIIPPGTNWQDVAELDYSNALMKQEMIKSMKYWLDAAGIDGFRCDAADMVPSAFWKDALATLKASTDKDLILLAEGAEASNFTAGFEMNYAWNFNTAIRNTFKSGASASTVFSTHVQEYNAIPTSAQKLRYTTNHDVYAWESSPVEDFTKAGSVTAFVITSYLGGIPLIYDGQEVARSLKINFMIKDPINWDQNPEIYSAYAKVMSAWHDLDMGKKESAVNYSSSNVVAFTRSDSQQEVFVLANVRSGNQSATIPAALQGTWTNALTGKSVEIGTSVSLSAYEYLIVSR